MRHRHRHAHIARRSDRLTPAMRAALKAAKSQPLRRVHAPGPGRPPWPAHPSTLAAMVRRELVRRDRAVSRKGYRMDLWMVTEAGLEALRPVEVVRRPAPLLIAEGWPDFTRDTGRAMRGEPGVFAQDEPAWLSEAA